MEFYRPSEVTVLTPLTVNRYMNIEGFSIRNPGMAEHSMVRTGMILLGLKHSGHTLGLRSCYQCFGLVTITLEEDFSFFNIQYVLLKGS
ncbi:hypothetical protein SRABI84_04765 [Peribacillus simplex]|uniref:hypothetical protein n=1 Tax=Peribacillus simplex TaxID=1478 RepID=UPI001D262144|nr:hypothetical protein [Peribacillus simplex]CAH0308477.1 hypothetical protein SRABI84_04765 [Peribacillus simplex]